MVCVFLADDLELAQLYMVGEAQSLCMFFGSVGPLVLDHVLG